jgi:hypothetical protein
VGTDAVLLRDRERGWAPVEKAERQLHANVARAPLGSTVYIENKGILVPSARDATLPGQAAVALLLFPNGTVDGNRVLFVEHDEALLRELKTPPERPIARFVVGPADVPQR